MFAVETLAGIQASATKMARAHAQKDGHWFARLIASNPRIAKRFPDHQEVAEKLEEAKEIDTLRDVASSGLLDAETSRPYREAFKRLVTQQ